MKKYVSLLVLFVGLVASVEAQRSTAMATVVGDTVITSSSIDTVFKDISVTAGYSALGIQVNALKISGTVTAKAYLYSSLDGTNYNLTDSAAAFANAAGAQSVWFTKTGGLPYVNYRVQVRNVGLTGSTESLAVKVYYVLRKFTHD